ncbi:hypothetical protein HG263_04705 [Pseudoalteromonas sp. JBTF-M23]|uniref:OmpR/PhoB-type domain-containing protein n=1 Tax=Pseudoalteromonas caenipelagi TaxID=2726988 RepID=A0A849VD24_9GAMM|nr:winged helix-turn-helix domain-containing protein [Pseudoalteromonas caenipelagi]NOU49834.1 hypothetical protein [Pseudoalteromonas caenipelagi]
MIQFLEYEFDELQTILFKAGQIVPLNSTQSKLLALFIFHPNKVLSKDDILEQVWQGKVVSEQVVFQNISQLRAILGESSIKTFPKKGYQWQLALTHSTSPNDIERKKSTNTDATSAFKASLTPSSKAVQIPQSDIAERAKKTNYIPAIVGVFLLMTVAFGLYWVKGYEQSSNSIASRSISDSNITLAYIPFTADSPRHFATELEQLNNQFDFVNVHFNIDTRSFINSPYMQYQQLGLTRELAFTGVLKSNGDGATAKQLPYLLELVVQGPQRSWTSYLYGVSMPDLVSQTQALVATLSHSNYFNQKRDSLLSAELTLINEHLGGSLHALPTLIEHLIDEKRFDAASGNIDLLLSQSELTHPLYYGYGKWLKGRLLQAKREPVSAQSYFEQADLLFLDANIYDLQAEVNKSIAELAHTVAHTKEDYEFIRHHLYKAASLARLGKKPVAEIRAYTLLSIKASKFGFKKERMDYLMQAKTLLAEYQLDDSHYMLPMYHFALFADTLSERIKFYHLVLDAPVTPDNYWVFFSSADALSQIYLKEGRSDKALTVIKKITEPARSAWLHAKYYRELADTDKAIEYGKTAFNLGRGQHINWLSLNSALLLLELQHNQGTNQSLVQYREFITNHATEWWLEWRKDRLTKVGITVTEQMAGL